MITVWYNAQVVAEYTDELYSNVYRLGAYIGYQNCDL